MGIGRKYQKWLPTRGIVLSVDHDGGHRGLLMTWTVAFATAKGQRIMTQWSGDSADYPTLRPSTPIALRYNPHRPQRIYIDPHEILRLGPVGE